MRELINDPFYEFIKKYDRCVIDYCLMKKDTEFHGIESHRAAVLFAMVRVIERGIADDDRSETILGKEMSPFPYQLDISKAQAVRIDAESFLYEPEIVRTDINGTVFYNVPDPDTDKGEQIPYWYAFLEPPHGSGYVPEDFRHVNKALFPEGTVGLEVYRWTDDWSNYFDDGHEWWGTACWSVFDPRLNRFAVILASATD